MTINKQINRQTDRQGEHPRNQGLAHPAHIANKRRAFIRRMESGGAILQTDCPDKKKPVVHVAQGSQILRIRAER